jgi:hypothetical protein
MSPRFIPVSKLETTMTDFQDTTQPEHSDRRAVIRLSADGRWRIVLETNPSQFVIQRYKGQSAKGAWRSISYHLSPLSLDREWERRTWLCDDFADLAAQIRGEDRPGMPPETRWEVAAGRNSALDLAPNRERQKTVSANMSPEKVAEALGLIREPTPSQARLFASAHRDNLAGLLDGIRIEHLSRLLSVAAARDAATAHSEVAASAITGLPASMHRGEPVRPVTRLPAPQPSHRRLAPVWLWLEAAE